MKTRTLPATLTARALSITSAAEAIRPATNPVTQTRQGALFVGEFQNLQDLLNAVDAFRTETFTFTDGDGSRYLFDVHQAWLYIDEYPRPVDAFRPADQGVTLQHLLLRYPEMNVTYALQTDITKPLLFVPHQGRYLLIDGWHRLFRAVAEGVGEVPAYTLTEEETRAIVTRPTF